MAAAAAGAGAAVMEASPIIAQGIASSSGLIGSILNWFANQELRQQQMAIYEDQKKWNHPANQMKMRIQAGLNPYGDYAAAASPSSPNLQSMASGLPENLNNVSNSLSALSNSTLGRLNYRIQKKALELEEKKLDQELKNMEVTRRGLTTDNLLKQIQLYIGEQTKDMQILGYNTNVAQALENLSRAVTENKYLDKNLEKQLEKIGLEIKKGKFDLNNILPAQLEIMHNQEKRTQELFEYEKEQRQFDKSGKAEFNKILSEIDNSKMPERVKNTLKIILFFGYQYINSSANKGYK